MGGMANESSRPSLIAKDGYVTGCTVPAHLDFSISEKRPCGGPGKRVLFRRFSPALAADWFGGARC